MEQIKPAYRPDDDTPFAGERWGCFWLIASLVGLVVLNMAVIWFFEPGVVSRLVIRYSFMLLGFWAVGVYFRQRFRR